MILIHSSLFFNRWAALFCPHRGFPTIILNKSLQVAYPSTFCDYPRMCNEFFRELRSFHTLLLPALKTAIGPLTAAWPRLRAQKYTSIIGTSYTCFPPIRRVFFRLPHFRPAPSPCRPLLFYHVLKHFGTADCCTHADLSSSIPFHHIDHASHLHGANLILCRHWMQSVFRRTSG